MPTKFPLPLDDRKLLRQIIALNDPLGIILCASKSEEHFALLELHKSGIHVASYLKNLLPKAELERKLHDAVQLARARLEAGKDDHNGQSRPVTPNL